MNGSEDTTGNGNLYAVLAAGGALAASAGTIVVNQGGSVSRVMLAGFFVAAVLGWGCLSLIAVKCFRDRDKGLGGNGGHWTTGAGLIIVFGLAARLFVVLATTPTVSDDIWRYIHDGATLAGGGNPYAAAPAELDEQTAAHPAVLDKINNPELVTIYQPTSQYVFAGLWFVRPSSLDPLGDKTFRLGFILIDMLVVVILLGILRGQGLSPWPAGLYALHPLVVLEVAGAGHQDVVALVFLLPALALAEPGRITCRRAVWSGILLALATAVKPLALPLAAVMAWKLRDKKKVVLWATVAGVLTGIALYLPFLLTDHRLSRLLETTNVFVDKWAFNSSIYYPLEQWFGKSVANAAAAIGLLAALVICVVKKVDLYRTAMVYLFAALLFSSTCHPWYMLWPLAFLPLAFSRALWLWSLSILFVYVVLQPGVEYRVPLWVMIVEYGFVYLLICIGFIKHYLQSGSKELEV